MPKLNSIPHAVQAAAREPVVQSLSRLRTHWKEGRWLGENNHYKQDTLNRVRRANGNFKDADMTEYIGASTLGHCFDGWSYLGRATEAEMAGDPGSAQHLGYYAELRAAMSLLAGEGIGIFNDSHVIVKENGECASFGKDKGTHSVVWPVLEEWSKTEVGSGRVMSVIRPGGITLADWVNQFGSSAQPVTEHWIENWGLDIARLKSDREARNRASYRPNTLRGIRPASILKTIDVVEKLWVMCEPIDGGGFPFMDRYLLRQVLLQIIDPEGDGLALPSGLQKKKHYVRRVDNMLNALVTGSIGLEFKRFLKFETDATPSSLLKDAVGKAKPEHVDHSRQVLARATLLLRLATGSVSELLMASDLSFEKELEFWWNTESVRRRLWGATNVPSAFSELWADVESALNDTEEWRRMPDTEKSHWGFWANTTGSGWILSTVERVFFWGLR